MAKRTELVKVVMVEMVRNGKKCPCGCDKPLLKGSKVARISTPSYEVGYNMLWACYCKGGLIPSKAKNEEQANNTRKHTIVVEVTNRDAQWLSEVGYMIESSRSGYKTMTRTHVRKNSSGKIVAHLLAMGYEVFVDGKRVFDIDEYDKFVSVVNIRHTEAEKSYH